MAWTSPRTWVVSEKITAAIMNTHVRDNLAYLKSVIDGTGSDPIISAQGGAKGLRLGTYTRVVETENGQLAFSWNASYNGTTWNRIDTLKPAYLVHFGDLVNMEYYQAAAGSNPITWTVVQTIPITGKITGKGFYDSGDVSVTNGSTQSFTHGLAAQPRFYSGQHNAGSGVARFPVAYVGAGGTTVAFVAVDSANVQIINNSGGTRLIRACAMI